MQDDVYPPPEPTASPQEPPRLEPAPPPPPKPPGPLRRLWRRWGRITLFYLTVASTLFAGFYSVISFYPLEHGSFPASVDGVLGALFFPPVFFSTLGYAAAILGFLTAHEMGHYLFCRHYGLNATLPYYLPNPIIFGTFGAVIRIRSPISNKRQLFDISIAGPLSGFAVALPIYVVGLAMSVKLPPGEGLADGLIMGDPLLHHIIGFLLFPGVGPNDVIVLSPLAMVGWFGCLVTAINLLPVSQLDGGHILYAVFGKRHTLVSLLVVAVMVTVALTTQYWGWLVWALLVTLIGLRHPPLVDESVSIGTGRRLLAAVALLIFVLCFMPVPVEVPELFEEGGGGSGDAAAPAIFDPPERYGWDEASGAILSHG